MKNYKFRYRNCRQIAINYFYPRLESTKIKTRYNALKIVWNVMAQDSLQQPSYFSGIDFSNPDAIKLVSQCSANVITRSQITNYKNSSQFV